MGGKREQERERYIRIMNLLQLVGWREVLLKAEMNIRTRGQTKNKFFFQPPKLNAEKCRQRDHENVLMSRKSQIKIFKML